MKRLFAILTLLLSPAVFAGGRTAEEEIIDHAKTIDVSRLDSSLASRGLEEWLRLGPPRVSELRWQKSHCDSKREAAAPPDRRPLCVRFAFKRGEVSGYGLIRVGTVGRGISGAPRFEHAVITTPEMMRQGRHETALTLSELAKVIAKLTTPP